jgi:polyisoprenoid-binding protein YceI
MLTEITYHSSEEDSMTIETQPQTETVWEFDNAHTAVEFAARNMMVNTVRGRFTEVEGHITGSLDDPRGALVEVTIDAYSIDTGNHRRDEHLRSADFLDTAAYPTIAFKSTRIEQSDTNVFRVRGDLTMKGITKEVELEAAIGGVGKAADGREVVGLTVTGVLSRQEWGVKWNVVLEAAGVLIGDAVRVNIDIEAIEQAHVEAAH